MKIYDGEITVTNACRYAIYGGETKRPIDIQSMVVKTNQGLQMSDLWLWIWNAHRCLIYGGKN